MIKRNPRRRATSMGQMNTFIRMDPTEENKVITAGFLKRVQREVDAVVDCR
jgi:hypothetical protein